MTAMGYGPPITPTRPKDRLGSCAVLRLYASVKHSPTKASLGERSVAGRRVTPTSRRASNLFRWPLTPRSHPFRAVSRSTSVTIRVTRRGSPARFTVSTKRIPTSTGFSACSTISKRRSAIAEPSAHYQTKVIGAARGPHRTDCRGQSDVPLTAHRAGYDRAISGRWDRRCGGVATPSGRQRR